MKGWAERTRRRGPVGVKVGAQDVGRGAGGDGRRPAFAPFDDSLGIQAQLAEPVPVKR